MQRLINKNILLGVTGGIAAYKSPDLVRQLRAEGATVQVIMTSSAKQFITPLTLQAVSSHPVRDSLWDETAEMAMGHIELARWADAIIIAPVTANTIAKLAQGNSDDLLTTVCLAAKAPLLIAPAMNQHMWQQAATQTNIHLLETRGVQIVGPGIGSQACGDIGPGRMSEPDEIVSATIKLFSNSLLTGKHVIITAGPTREALDPVRFLSNHSTGKMGFALAQAAIEAGAQVTLISGPVNLVTPEHVKRIDIISAQDMLEAVQANLASCDIFIGVAAVADYQLAEVSTTKVKKSSADLQLNLIKTPDIIAVVANSAPKPFTVGFCLETENLLANAQEKLSRKNLDMIVANSVSETTGFGSDTNAVLVLSNTQQIELSLANKYQIARELVKIIASEYTKEI